MPPARPSRPSTSPPASIRAAGDTLDYTSETDGETMTIWFGPKGSPAFYKGRWSDDGNTLSGEWEWPGGGYKETMTRIEPAT